MREAAQLAEANRRLFEIERRESISIGALRLDAETIEKGAADEMRRLPGHRAEAEIDARLTKISRQKLRMRIGDVQDAGIAEALEIVNAALRAVRSSRQAAGERCGARYFKKIPAVEGHDRHCAIFEPLAYLKILPGVLFVGRLENRSLGQSFGLFRGGNRRLEILFLGGRLRLGEGGFSGEPLVTQAAGFLLGGICSGIGRSEVSVRACGQRRAADQKGEGHAAQPHQSAR